MQCVFTPEKMERYLAGDKAGIFTYGRSRNPTQNALQQKIAALEGAPAALGGNAEGQGLLHGCQHGLGRYAQDHITASGCSAARQRVPKKAQHEQRQHGKKSLVHGRPAR